MVTCLLQSNSRTESEIFLKSHNKAPSLKLESYVDKKEETKSENIYLKYTFL